MSFSIYSSIVDMTFWMEYQPAPAQWYVLQGICHRWTLQDPSESLGFSLKQWVFTCFYPLSFDLIFIHWLVVSNMNLIFHNIWDVILPIDELIFFRGVGLKPPTSTTIVSLESPRRRRTFFGHRVRGQHTF